jgi:hypothetical protein
MKFQIVKYMEFTFQPHISLFEISLFEMLPPHFPQQFKVQSNSL